MTRVAVSAVERRTRRAGRSCGPGARSRWARPRGRGRLLLAVGLFPALVVTPAVLGAEAWADTSDPDPFAATRIVRTLEDDLGRRITWEAPPRRIVSLSPSLTEILFALGADRTTLVGVTRFCNYPPAAKQIAKVGGIVDPSLEAVLALRPDLVLATRGNPLEFIESLASLAVPVFALDTRGSLATILATIRSVGAATGREVEAARLVDSLAARQQALERRTGALPPEARPRVYYGPLEGTLWTAGPGSYLDALIRIAGGRNVAAQAPSAWSPLSLEIVLAEDPQVYLGSFAGADTPARRAEAEADARAFLRGHGAWRETALGREPRIYMVHEDRLLRPAPRIYAVMEAFAEFLHPGLGARGEAGAGARREQGR